ncbi:MAG TPA: M14 metallopeptidase family protein, partial [Vicinamibacterales bacterium]|nr:M14 metallopeptidase family protein [Vicinamibacterales bacterium]
MALHGAQDQLPTPQQFLGFAVGADNKLARWDAIVQYFDLVAARSPRVRVRDLGKSTLGNRFLTVEIAAPDTLAQGDRYKQLQRKLYFQDGPPTAAERDEILRDGKAVVLVTCSMHATEVGATQMALELVHRLATEDSPLVRKILDRVILVLVPSLNPDGQIMVADWFDKNLGTEFEHSPMPWLYHPYVGHDNNRDMYAFTQVESQLTARLLWHDWFPAVWLDEHQMGNAGARIFVMPATDPINPNVHPLIYRWNGIFGQAQAAALEAAGKDGIIYNSTYTNFWQGAMAWSGWWHNQVGLLTEVASVRVAAPVDQLRAIPGAPAPAAADGQGRRQAETRGPLPAPRDITPRTEYPRPWLGGRWTLRDIVDYELIATMATLEAAADQRDALLRHIYEVNRVTVESPGPDMPAAVVIPTSRQHDRGAVLRLVDKLQLGGVQVWRAAGAFEADGVRYDAGSFVIPLNQVFGRYAKDLLEKQTYPEVRRTPGSPPEPPYDVTAWSLGMLMGVDTVFLKQPVPDAARLERLADRPTLPGSVTGSAQSMAFDYRGPDAAIAVNRLLKEGARVAWASRAGAARFVVSGVPRARLQALATEFGLDVAPAPRDLAGAVPVKAPRVALYQPWTASMDEGWTRWVLEQYEFAPATIHNAQVRAGGLRGQFDAIVLADQQAASIVHGNASLATRPEYRGGIGDEGVRALKAFVEEGGTLVALGASTDLVIQEWPVGLRNVKRGLSRDQHFAPGTIVRLQVDTASGIGAGMPAETYGFYNNSPFFERLEGFESARSTIVARYP